MRKQLYMWDSVSRDSRMRIISFFIHKERLQLSIKLGSWWGNVIIFQEFSLFLSLFLREYFHDSFRFQSCDQDLIITLIHFFLLANCSHFFSSEHQKYISWKKSLRERSERPMECYSHRSDVSWGLRRPLYTRHRSPAAVPYTRAWRSRARWGTKKGFREALKTCLLSSLRERIRTLVSENATKLYRVPWDSNFNPAREWGNEAPVPRQYSTSSSLFPLLLQIFHQIPRGIWNFTVPVYVFPCATNRSGLNECEAESWFWIEEKEQFSGRQIIFSHTCTHARTLIFKAKATGVYSWNIKQSAFKHALHWISIISCCKNTFDIWI